MIIPSKNRIFSFGLALALLSACDRNSANRGDEQRQADEKRIAELRDLEQSAAQREMDAKAAQNDLERQRLADAQAALDVEKQKLAEERAAVQATAEQQAHWRAEEQRLAQRQASLKAEQAAAARAERDANAAQAHAEETQDGAERPLDSFYSALDPMGDWMQVEPYGYCWQPHEAQDESWRPYVDGSWAYTNYGWTWRANEPFGWATYHYGRWARIKHTGWVWVPGPEWAPAWVSWRRSPEYVGWAALPPEAHSGGGFDASVDSYYDIGPSSYNFVAMQRFGEPTFRGVLVEPERNVTIVNQTVNVTRINYTTIENKTVVFAGGPDLAQINTVSARQIPRLKVERVNEAGAGVATAVVAGGVLKMLAPHFASAARPASAPVKVKEVIKAAQVERGWTGADPAAAQALRAQAKEEALQAEAHARSAKPAAISAAPVRAIAPASAPPLTPDTRAADAARISAEKKAALESATTARIESQQQKTMADREAAAQKLEEAKRALEEQRKEIAEKRAVEATAREATTNVAAPPPTAAPRERPMPANVPPKTIEKKLPEPNAQTGAPIKTTTNAKPPVDPKAKLDKKRAAEEAAKGVPGAPPDPTKQ